MNDTRPISDYSRQELYDLVWSTPAIKLATDFGISNVAIAKRCKTRSVPRPSRGYWAKMAAGRRPRKTPLPPTPEELFKQAAQRRVRKSLPLPATTEPLLPLATELMNAIPKAKLDHYKRARLEEPALPRVTASRHLAERVAGAFHVLLKELEPLGITFRKYQGTYESGYFHRRGDRLHLDIAEDIVRPDGSIFSAPYWESPQGKEKPSGRLTFTVKPSTYSSEGTKTWSETPKLPLEQVLAQVVTGIRKHFLEVQERRQQAEIESAKRQPNGCNARGNGRRRKRSELRRKKSENTPRQLLRPARHAKPLF